LIQLTGIDNYRSYGAYIKQDLTGENKFKVEKPKLASDSAGWYWIAGRGENLNGPADENDLIYLTASINGAFNGYEGSATSRLTLLRNAANALHIAACPRMDALYSVFPEAERFSTESYTLEKSRAYEKHDMAFAWGYWHDPTSKQHGTRKDKEQAVIGYRRYLELLEAKPLKAKKGRFKMSRVEMKNLAEERLNALSK
jgi:putative chitinase